MNLEFYKKQLTDLKRSNKDRKLKLAQRYGYDTIGGYKSGLESAINTYMPVEKPVIKTVEVEKPVIHTIYILDRSSSMRGKIDNAVNGIIQDSKALDESTINLYSVIGFSYNSHICLELNRVDSIKTLSSKVGGFTALYDGIMTSLPLINKDEKTIIKIFTDGGENDSKNCLSETKESLQSYIEQGVTVTFVGTKSDTKDIVNKLGLDESNTLTHNNTAKGVEKAFEVTANATRNYSKKVLAGEDTLTGFYKTTGKL